MQQITEIGANLPSWQSGKAQLDRNIKAGAGKKTAILRCIQLLSVLNLLLISASAFAQHCRNHRDMIVPVGTLEIEDDNAPIGATLRTIQATATSTSGLVFYCSGGTFQYRGAGVGTGRPSVYPTNIPGIGYTVSGTGAV